MKNLITVLAFLLALCLPLHAQETATSITQLQEKAEAGDAEAQYQLGKAYETGEGVIKYLSTARYWYEKALEICDRNIDDYIQPTHCDDAAYRLALITEAETGGDEKQRAAARKYWQKAATWGNPNALRQLKLRAWTGDSESAAYLAQLDSGENEKKAWLTIAAHMEEADIDWEMAQDSSIDNDEKYIWLARAINAGHPEARKDALEYDEKAFHLGEIFAQGMGVFLPTRHRQTTG